MERRSFFKLALAALVPGIFHNAQDDWVDYPIDKAIENCRIRGLNTNHIICDDYQGDPDDPKENLRSVYQAFFDKHSRDSRVCYTTEEVKLGPIIRKEEQKRLQELQKMMDKVEIEVLQFCNPGQEEEFCEEAYHAGGLAMEKVRWQEKGFAILDNRKVLLAEF